VILFVPILPQVELQLRFVSCNKKQTDPHHSMFAPSTCIDNRYFQPQQPFVLGCTSTHSQHRSYSLQMHIYLLASYGRPTCDGAQGFTVSMGQRGRFSFRAPRRSKQSLQDRASEREPFSEHTEQEKTDEDNELLRARRDRFQKLLPKMGHWTGNCKLVPPFKMVLRTKVL